MENSKLKKRICAALLSSVFFCGHVTAQILVTDTLGIAKSVVHQVQLMQQWVQQFQAMRDQLDQTRAQLKAMSGARGLANLLNNPDIQALLPDGAADLIVMSKRLPSFAKERSKYRTYPSGRPRANALFDTIAAHAALATELYSKSNRRLTQIEELRKQIDFANDPAEKADLNNRLVAEMNAVNGEISQFERLKQIQTNQLDEANQNAQQEILCIEFKKKSCT
jgi:type IV secretion system protein VirB5